MEYKLRTPVAIAIFNSPENARELARRVSRASPPQVFIIADGPRPEVLGEDDKCNRARRWAEQELEGCNVRINYSDHNMGCGQRLASGFSWVFDNVEEAIILEDDCWPHPTFFRFCDELLERYRNDERVMIISGTNHLGKWRHRHQSYHFSLHGGIWGWATWRRAWNMFDFEMQAWNDVSSRQKVLARIHDKYDRQKRAKSFEGNYHNDAPTSWAIQWYFTRLLHKGYSIIPAVNLISNVGIGPDRAHFVKKTNIINLPTKSMSFPLRAPQEVAPDQEYDKRYFRKITARPWTLRYIRKNLPYWSRLVRTRLQRMFSGNRAKP